MRALVEFFVNRSIFVNMMTVILMLGGAVVASVLMNREAFPNIDFDIVSVTTVYPGASPEEVEKLVTNRLEESIQEVDGMKEYKSTSIESRSNIVVTIDPDIEDTQKVVDDITSAVERTEDIPEDAEKSIITEISTARQPVIEVSLARKLDENGTYLLSERELREEALRLEDQLLDLRGVARVVRRGYRDTEMHVNVNPAALRENYISTQQIISALAARNVNLPGGKIESELTETVVRTLGEFDTAQEIANVFIRSNDIGQAVRVRDVATVNESFADAEYLERTDGYSAIALTVVKRESADAITVVDSVRDLIKEFRETAPPSIQYAMVNDLSFFIRRRLGILINNGAGGLLLVVIALFVFLGWRSASMAALGIPIAIGMAFILMHWQGVTLNLISMFGLILVIGIVVDDAIIVCENIYRYLEEGYDAREAAIRGTAQVVAPVMATISTTIAAFGPMLFVSGIFGKFIFTIPFVIILTLIASFFESIFILPSHMYDMNKYASPHKEEQRTVDSWFESFRLKVYQPVLNWALDHKFLFLVGMHVTLIASFVLLAAFGKFKLFPSAIDAFRAKVTAERGQTLDSTLRFARAVEHEIRKLPAHELGTEAENVLGGFVTRIGIQQKDANDPFTRRGSNYGQVFVYLTPEVNRISGEGRRTDPIMDELRLRTSYLLPPEKQKVIIDRYNEGMQTRNAGLWNSIMNTVGITEEPRPIEKIEVPPEFAHLAGTIFSLEFEKQEGGPPVGKAIAIEITGDSFETLEEIGEKYKAVLRTIDGVVDIDDDFPEGKEEIRLKINERMASQTGVSIQQIALAVNAAFEGTVATTIKRPDEEVDVRVQFDEKFRADEKSLSRIYVTNNAGNLIPASRMASFERGVGFESINHVDGTRLLTVTANVVEEKITSNAANAQAQAKSKEILKDYKGYNVKFGGENEDTEESLASLGFAFVLGIMIIFMILSSLFRSVMQPFVVLAAVPFAFIGVIIAFVTHNEYFGFLAFMGIIGLGGVVVNDSIVLVDFANNLMRENEDLSPREAVFQAGNMRLRAVMLTTITTVLGLLPTAYGIGGHDPFLVPMALAFSWGLAFSTVLTLLMVPILYSGQFELHNKLGRMWEKVLGHKLRGYKEYNMESGGGGLHSNNGGGGTMSSPSSRKKRGE